MAARRATMGPVKRPGAEGNESSAKRPKPRDDTVEGKLETVTAALQSEVARLESSQEMLLAMARGCLLTPVEQRHKYQKAVGDMLHEVFIDIEGKTKLNIDGAIAEVDRIVARRASLGNDRGIVEEKLSARAAALSTAKHAFCKDNIALQTARKAVKQAVETQSREDTSAREASENKVAMEAALKEHFPSLTSDSCKDLGPHVDAITSVSEKVKLEESLVRAFSVAARKMPGVRSPFDGAVLKQLQGELIKHAAILEAAVAAGEPGMTARAAAVAAAQSDLQVARQSMQKSAAALRAFDIEQRERIADVWDAKDAERSAEEELLMAEKEQMAAENHLEDFRAGPRAALEVLLRRRAEPHAAEMPAAVSLTPVATASGHTAAGT